MEKFNVDGIVIKTSVTGESDKILWILTRNRGIIRAFAKGARGTKSRLHSGASLFAFCSFAVYEKNDVFHINEAEIKEIFFELRTSIENLTLAQYFCEVLLKTLPENVVSDEYMRLLLNCLYFLCKEKKPVLLIKSVFELRIASLAGYMPSLVACDNCGEFESEEMFFNCENGLLLCSSCGKNTEAPLLPLPVITAMRHIVFSSFEKIFSFSLPDELLEKLNIITQKYLENCFQQKFRLLDYFDTLK